MATPTLVTINGKQFQINDLHPFVAVKINSQLAAIFGPLLMGRVRDVSSLLLEMPMERQELLMSMLISTTKYLPSGENAGALELSDKDAVAQAFGADLESLYTLAFAIMEHNGFPFFKSLRETGARYLEMVQGLQKAAMDGLSGAETSETDGSGSPMSAGAASALNSPISGALQKKLRKSTPSGGSSLRGRHR